jgi:hypothetical protein
MARKRNSSDNSPNRKGGEPKASHNATGGRNKRVSVETYDRMWIAYQEHQTYSHVARAAGVARACATRYCKENDPDRNLPALEWRYRRLQEQTADIADRSVAEDRARLLRDADRVQDAIMKQIEDKKAEFKDPARALKAIAEIRLAVAKESDDGKGGGGGSREALDALTDEQVGDQLSALFARLGIMDDPKRSRRSPRKVALDGPERPS